jgi:hypothetical protein
MMLRALLISLALLAPAPASAWWEYGHYTVAEIAERTVRPASRAEIKRLIGRAALLETPECPVRSLADAAYWPDCIRAYKERFSYSFPWHYQNVDICKPFDQASACRDGNCVSAQIERNAKLLADRKLPDRERLQALAYLAHFVGDMHMPLHAGDRGDKGGNEFAASYGVIAGRANLHSIWDGYLAERGISNPQGGTAGLLAEFGARRATLISGTVTDWARESWETSRTFAYGSVMADPCGPKPATRPVIDEATTRALIPVVRAQIARGGLRLGRLLDEALA